MTNMAASVKQATAATAIILYSHGDGGMNRLPRKKGLESNIYSVVQRHFAYWYRGMPNRTGYNQRVPKSAEICRVLAMMSKYIYLFWENINVLKTSSRRDSFNFQCYN